MALCEPSNGRGSFIVDSSAPHRVCRAPRSRGRQRARLAGARDGQRGNHTSGADQHRYAGPVAIVAGHPTRTQRRRQSGNREADLRIERHSRQAHAGVEHLPVQCRPDAVGGAGSEAEQQHAADKQRGDCRSARSPSETATSAPPMNTSLRPTLSASHAQTGAVTSATRGAASRSAAATRRARLRARSRRNSGDSGSERRTHQAINTSSTLAKNGTRQPHASRSASLRNDTGRSTLRRGTPPPGCRRGRAFMAAPSPGCFKPKASAPCPRPTNGDPREASSLSSTKARRI